MRQPGIRLAPIGGFKPGHFCAPPSNEKNSAVVRHTVWTRTFALLFGAITLATGCASDRDDARFDLVLLGGHVIDVESGETLRDRDIWIVDDRIDSIKSIDDSLAIHPYSPDARQKLAELTGATGE